MAFRVATAKQQPRLAPSALTAIRPRMETTVPMGILVKAAEEEEPASVRMAVLVLEAASVEWVAAEGRTV